MKGKELAFVMFLPPLTPDRWRADCTHMVQLMSLASWHHPSDPIHRVGSPPVHNLVEVLDIEKRWQEWLALTAQNWVLVVWLQDLAVV